MVQKLYNHSSRTICHYFTAVQSRTWLDAGTGPGFGKNLFLDHIKSDTAIHLIKLMASTVLSAATLRHILQTQTQTLLWNVTNAQKHWKFSENDSAEKHKKTRKHANTKTDILHCILRCHCLPRQNLWDCNVNVETMRFKTRECN